MAKKYVDFIHDAIDNPKLAKDLKSQTFDSAASVKQWFAEKGYTLDDQESESLFKNQEKMKKAESPNY